MDTGGNAAWQSFAFALLEEMKEQLLAVSAEETMTLVRAFKSIQVCKGALDRLKQHVLESGFGGREEEIYFFKELKPQFQGKLIYFHKLFKIETGMPVGGRKEQRVYLQKEMQELQDFFEKNQFFYQYYRGNVVYLDEKLFLRYQQLDAATMGYIVDLDADPAFSTAGDFFVAKILANDLLAKWLEVQLQALDAAMPEKLGTEPIPELTWTASKADMGELIYALYEGKVFNNGHANVKQVADFVCKAFNVKIGNIYKVFEELRLRKTKSRTEFMDMLRDALERRMEEDDE